MVIKDRDRVKRWSGQKKKKIYTEINENKKSK